MSNAVRRVLAMSLATALMLALVWLWTSHDQAEATAAEDQTCKDVGFQNLETDVSGPWGSVDFDSSSDTLEVVVNAGYRVRLCIKAGSAQQGDGPEVSDWLDPGSYSMTHSSGKDLSHYGLIYEQTTTTTTASDEEPTTTTTLPETTTTAGETTTTNGETTTTTLPETTTTDETSSTVITTTTLGTPSPGDAGVLPFTGVEDWLAPTAGILALAGLVVLTLAGRLEDEIDLD